MHLKVTLKDCSLGKGLFASEWIRANDLVFYINGRELTYEEGLRLPCGGDHTVQIGPNRYINPQYPSKFINHSCDPNAGLRDGIRVVALRDIRPGEQVCFDYSTCVLERSWRMDCACGSPNCRRVIGDFDQLPRALQQRYIELGIVQPFILEMLQVRLPEAFTARSLIHRASSVPPPRRELAVR